LIIYIVITVTKTHHNSSIKVLAIIIIIIIIKKDYRHCQQNIPVVCQGQCCEWLTADRRSVSELCPRRPVECDLLVVPVPTVLHSVPQTSQPYIHIINYHKLLIHIIHIIFEPSVVVLIHKNNGLHDSHLNL